MIFLTERHYIPLLLNMKLLLKMFPKTQDMKKVTNCKKNVFQNSAKYRIHVFLWATLFFNSASVLLKFFINAASGVAYVLLTAHNHHHTETHFTFSIFVSCLGLDLFMLYLCDPYFIFSLIFIIINHTI